MYYSKEELERMRKEGEKWSEEREKKSKGSKYRSLAGLPIKCNHCQNETFLQSRALLNSRGMTFFNLDWLDQGAVTLTCTKCGYIHWFNLEVEEVKEVEE